MTSRRERSGGTRAEARGRKARSKRRDQVTGALAPDTPLVILAFACILGVGLRASAVLARDFPLNDGGLFFSMIQDLLGNGFQSPLHASYNAASIPFVYPPFGLYTAAVLAQVGIPLTQVLRFVPLVASAASIPAAYGLACKILDDRLAASFAALAIAVLPESFHWRIMGGGITRAFGFLFGVLTLDALLRLLRTRGWKNITLAGVFGAATVLSHPEADAHVAIGAIVLLAFHMRHKDQLKAIAFAAGLVLMITAIWWLPALRSHGLAPWLAAARSRALFPAGVLFLALVLTLDPVTQVLSLFGLIFGRRQKVALILTYTAVMFVLMPRGANQFAVLAVALAFGVGAKIVAESILRPREAEEPARRSAPNGFRASYAALSILIAVMFLPNWISTATSPILGSLSPGEREAMAWARQNTELQSTFLVVEGRDFLVARDSEWFPALTGRVSAATVQGYEWLDTVDIAERTRAFGQLQQCGLAGEVCISAWAKEHAVNFSYIYVVRDSASGPSATSCCQPLVDDLDKGTAFEKIFENQDVAIYRRRG